MFIVEDKIYVIYQLTIEYVFNLILKVSVFFEDKFSQHIEKSINFIEYTHAYTYTQPHIFMSAGSPSVLDSHTNILLAMRSTFVGYQPPAVRCEPCSSPSRTIDFIAFSLSCLKMKLKTIHTQSYLHVYPSAYLLYTALLRAGLQGG